MVLGYKHNSGTANKIRIKVFPSTLVLFHLAGNPITCIGSDPLLFAKAGIPWCSPSWYQKLILMQVGWWQEIKTGARAFLISPVLTVVLF